MTYLKFFAHLDSVDFLNSMQQTNSSYKKSKIFYRLAFGFNVFAIFLLNSVVPFEAMAYQKKQKVIVLTAQHFLGAEVDSENPLKNLVLKVLHFLPQSHFSSLQQLKIDFNKPNTSRGLANSKLVFLNKTSEVSLSELVSVMVHEIGHVADLGFLKTDKKLVSQFAGISAADPSTQFYKISWKQKTEPYIKNARYFVSGYATSNIFEDFAESYNMYIFHGKNFRERMLKNTTLRKKYNFLKYKVFEGREFDFAKKDYQYPEYFFDSTVIPYDFPLFIQAIKNNKTNDPEEEIYRRVTYRRIVRRSGKRAVVYRYANV